MLGGAYGRRFLFSINHSACQTVNIGTSLWRNDRGKPWDVGRIDIPQRGSIAQNLLARA
jgi:hypothetical protein